MNTKKLSSTVVALFVVVCSVSSQTKYVDASAKMPSHPRLIMLKGEERSLLSKINKDPYW